MTEIEATENKTEQAAVSIAAVTFVNMEKDSLCKLNTGSDKPYFYINVIMAKVGDLALVHNGDAFGVVKVARILDIEKSAALSRVTKPLLSLINYDEELLATASAKLKEFVDKTTDMRVQENIDRELDGRAKNNLRFSKRA